MHASALACRPWGVSYQCRPSSVCVSPLCFCILSIHRLVAWQLRAALHAHA